MQNLTSPQESYSFNHRSLSVSLPDISGVFDSHCSPPTFIKIGKKEDDQEVPENSPMSKERTKIIEMTGVVNPDAIKTEKKSQSSSVTQAHRWTRMSIKSDFMRSLVLSDGSSFEKVYFLVKKVLGTHILAFLLTLVKIGIQNLMDQYCWMDKICNCGDKIETKIYSSLMDFLTTWILYSIINLKTVWVFKEIYSIKRAPLFQSVYFILLFGAVIAYGVITPEEEYSSLEIYLILILLPFCMMLLYLKRLNMNFKRWIAQIGRSSYLNIFIFANYLLIRYLLPEFKNFVDTHFSIFWARNILQLMTAVYFNLFFFGMKMLLYVYYRLLRSENNKYDVGVTLMRFALGFGYSLNFASLIKMQPQDLGGWVLLVLYIHFVLKTYANFNIFSFLFSKIQTFVNKNEVIIKKTEPFNPEKVYFEKLYSGCMLDFQLIAILRILSWLALDRWFGVSFVLIFVKNCSFEIGENFNSSIFGLCVLLTMNFIMVASVFAYMIKRKRILLEYKVNKNVLYNIFVLFLLHSFFEACVQVCFNIYI